MRCVFIIIYFKTIEPLCICILVVNQVKHTRTIFALSIELSMGVFLVDSLGDTFLLQAHVEFQSRNPKLSFPRDTTCQVVLGLVCLNIELENNGLVTYSQ